MDEKPFKRKLSDAIGYTFLIPVFTAVVLIMYITLDVPFVRLDDEWTQINQIYLEKPSSSTSNQQTGLSSTRINTIYNTNTSQNYNYQNSQSPQRKSFNNYGANSIYTYKSSESNLNFGSGGGSMGSSMTANSSRKSRRSQDANSTNVNFPDLQGLARFTAQKNVSLSNINESNELAYVPFEGSSTGPFKVSNSDPGEGDPEGEPLPLGNEFLILIFMSVVYTLVIKFRK